MSVVFLITDVEPLQDFAILVSNESGTVGSQEDLSYCFCQSSSADPESPITRYDTTCFEPLHGRYLTILLRSNAQIAVICEVQVYGGKCVLMYDFDPLTLKVPPIICSRRKFQILPLFHNNK